ncbi:Lrp/AsnC family transcriptional regulator [Thalassospira marina]|uniref:AsnC family transcriptional regulator n=1 Tax=Thalassospira marina TaxID=2048283 RepID=A0ABN5FL62_9PROT|nr:Lrp/AsnC family transcriptional regulator [Thalassospira marina]AUG52180.1 AsnC family transcriptional regulator [Thalassospira marina]
MPQIEIDTKDRMIIDLLQQDGRLSNVDLAERINLSPSPCYRRVKRLEDAGVIENYGARINRHRAGLGLTVFTEVKVERHNRTNADALGEALCALPEVVSCFMVSGTADFMAEIVVADLAAYERLLSEKLLTLPMVADIRSNFALRSLKIDGPLSVSQTLEKRE